MLRESMLSDQVTLEIDSVTKRFAGATVLDAVSLDVYRHDFTLINGPSGSGKTTLLDIASGLLRPDEGRVSLENRAITAMGNDALTEYRSHYGHAFQQGGLIKGMSVGDNIVRPHRINRQPIDPEYAMDICNRLGIISLLDQSAGTLSGGQKARVALARGLVHQPQVLFADEPTAALDSESTQNVHEILKGITDEKMSTVVMVSHDEISKEYADRVITLRDGVVENTFSR